MHATFYIQHIDGIAWISTSYSIQIFIVENNKPAITTPKLFLEDYLKLPAKSTQNRNIQKVIKMKMNGWFLDTIHSNTTTTTTTTCNNRYKINEQRLNS